MAAEFLTKPVDFDIALALCHGAAGDVAPILLSSLMCTALSLCCDDWVVVTMPPWWLRLAEAAGCAVAVALGMALIVVYLPEALVSWTPKMRQVDKVEPCP